MPSLFSRKDTAQILRKEGVDNTTIALLETHGELAQARSAIAKGTERRNELEAVYEAQLAEFKSEGVKKVAIAGVTGAGVAVLLVYLAHDELANYFGRGSWPAMLILPGAGAALFVFTSKELKKKSSKYFKDVETRAAAFGASLGLIVYGGYCSYQDYNATPAA